VALPVSAAPARSQDTQADLARACPPRLAL